MQSCKVVCSTGPRLSGARQVRELVNFGLIDLFMGRDLRQDPIKILIRPYLLDYFNNDIEFDQDYYNLQYCSQIHHSCMRLRLRLYGTRRIWDRTNIRPVPTVYTGKQDKSVTCFSVYSVEKDEFESGSIFVRYRVNGVLIIGHYIFLLVANCIFAVYSVTTMKRMTTVTSFSSLFV